MFRLREIPKPLFGGRNGYAGVMVAIIP